MIENTQSSRYVIILKDKADGTIPNPVLLSDKGIYDYALNVLKTSDFLEVIGSYEGVNNTQWKLALDLLCAKSGERSTKISGLIKQMDKLTEV